MNTEPPAEPPTPINPTRARRAPDGRLALYFPERGRNDAPFWLHVAIRNDLYIEILSEDDVADWAEVTIA